MLIHNALESQALLLGLTMLKIDQLPENRGVMLIGGTCPLRFVLLLFLCNITSYLAIL